MELTLNSVSNALYRLTEEYALKYPEFAKLEREYAKEYDKIALQSFDRYSSQSARDSHTKEQMRALPVYEKYQSMAVDIKVLEIRMWNLRTISKNLQNSTWETVRGEIDG